MESVRRNVMVLKEKLDLERRQKIRLQNEKKEVQGELSALQAGVADLREQFHLEAKAASVKTLSTFTDMIAEGASVADVSALLSRMLDNEINEAVKGRGAEEAEDGGGTREEKMMRRMVAMHETMTELELRCNRSEPVVERWQKLRDGPMQSALRGARTVLRELAAALSTVRDEVRKYRQCPFPAGWAPDELVALGNMDWYALCDSQLSAADTALQISMREHIHTSLREMETKLADERATAAARLRQEEERCRALQLALAGHSSPSAEVPTLRPDDAECADEIPAGIPHCGSEEAGDGGVRGKRRLHQAESMRRPAGKRFARKVKPLSGGQSADDPAGTPDTRGGDMSPRGEPLAQSMSPRKKRVRAKAGPEQREGADKGGGGEADRRVAASDFEVDSAFLLSTASTAIQHVAETPSVEDVAAGGSSPGPGRSPGEWTGLGDGLSGVAANARAEQLAARVRDLEQRLAAERRRHATVDAELNNLRKQLREARAAALRGTGQHHDPAFPTAEPAAATTDPGTPGGSVEPSVETVATQTDPLPAPRFPFHPSVRPADGGASGVPIIGAAGALAQRDAGQVRAAGHGPPAGPPPWVRQKPKPAPVRKRDTIVDGTPEQRLAATVLKAANMSPGGEKKDGEKKGAKAADAVHPADGPPAGKEVDTEGYGELRPWLSVADLIDDPRLPVPERLVRALRRERLRLSRSEVETAIRDHGVKAKATDALKLSEEALTRSEKPPPAAPTPSPPPQQPPAEPKPATPKQQQQAAVRQTSPRTAAVSPRAATSPRPPLSVILPPLKGLPQEPSTILPLSAPRSADSPVGRTAGWRCRGASASRTRFPKLLNQPKCEPEVAQPKAPSALEAAQTQMTAMRMEQLHGDLLKMLQHLVSFLSLCVKSPPNLCVELQQLWQHAHLQVGAGGSINLAELVDADAEMVAKVHAALLTHRARSFRSRINLRILPLAVTLRRLRKAKRKSIREGASIDTLAHEVICRVYSRVQKDLKRLSDLKACLRAQEMKAARAAKQAEAPVRAVVVQEAGGA
eukprot:TRINITY_DN9955_c0_g1_i2.p1 TRINITY_DN9955_c0_g1~~TRINITY_DN9955_c0_g1_i2.p1  ORF type:complete len:1156 (+),score=377.66 TRINITY_DN9955_c0_g1_i2:363-3470(+)